MVREGFGPIAFLTDDMAVPELHGWGSWQSPFTGAQWAREAGCGQGTGCWHHLEGGSRETSALTTVYLPPLLPAVH